ncbi:class I SAM-dependent methyltransferase [Sulfurimonas sp.]
MLSILKKRYIKLVESYLLKASKKKFETENLKLKNIDNINSIKEHIIDLNERYLENIDVDVWFEKTKNLYRLYSSVYRYEATKNIIERYIDINNSSNIDFGAGNGVFLEYLNLKGTGVDINKKCVNHMKKIGIEAYELNELNDLFEDKYDNAFAFEVIEHVENQLMVLDSIHSYIKDDAYCFVSIPYVKNSHVLKKEDDKTAIKRLENYHIFELDTKDFKNLISHSKFELIEFTHINPHSLSLNPIGKFFDWFFRASKPKWTIFILKKVKN